MVGYDLAGYQPVEERLAAFWAMWPLGRVVTDLVAYSDQAFIVKAEVYRAEGDTAPAASGYAEERVGSNPVNRTSALENCETSAVGRALANLGFAPKGARPSREEMAKVERAAAEHKALAREVQRVDRSRVERVKTPDPAAENPWHEPFNLPDPGPSEGQKTYMDAEPVTSRQLAKIGALMAKCRLTDHDEALKYVNTVLDLPPGTIGSRKDLSKGQASRLIDELARAAEVVAGAETTR